MKHKLFGVAFAAIMVLHHDWWLWDDGRLLFGFLPVGLAYHALISIAAGLLWAWAVLGVWPELFEDAGETAA
jgi:hypothetical protein